MKSKLKLFFLSFLISLPFWWGVNIAELKLENFLFWREITKNPELLTAQANAQYKLFLRKKEEKINKELKKINVGAALSVKFDEKGGKKVVFEQNAQKPLPIASLTKLMTALVVFDIYKLDEIITVNDRASKQTIEANSFALKQGEKLSVKSLLYIMLIESNNRAAFALTEPIGEKAFVDLMNINVKNLGLKNTHFFNPAGLDEINGKINYSTAEDLVKLAHYILKKYPQIFEITAKRSWTIFSLTNDKELFVLKNTNELLGKMPDIIGGKTGETPKAKGCLLLVIKNPSEDNYFINVILGSDNRFEEMWNMTNLLN